MAIALSRRQHGIHNARVIVQGKKATAVMAEQTSPLPPKSVPKLSRQTAASPTICACKAVSTTQDKVPVPSVLETGFPNDKGAVAIPYNCECKRPTTRERRRKGGGVMCCEWRLVSLQFIFCLGVAALMTLCCERRRIMIPRAIIQTQNST